MQSHLISSHLFSAKLFCSQSSPPAPRRTTTPVCSSPQTRHPPWQAKTCAKTRPVAPCQNAKRSRPAATRALHSWFASPTSLRPSEYASASTPRSPIKTLADPTLDCRPRFSYRRSLYVHSARQNNLPDHHLGRALAANIRLEARAQPRLHHAPADTTGHHRNHGMEKIRLRSLGRQWARLGTRRLGIPAR